MNAGFPAVKKHNLWVEHMRDGKKTKCNRIVGGKVIFLAWFLGSVPNTVLYAMENSDDLGQTRSSPSKLVASQSSSKTNMAPEDTKPRNKVPSLQSRDQHGRTPKHFNYGKELMDYELPDQWGRDPFSQNHGNPLPDYFLNQYGGVPRCVIL